MTVSERTIYLLTVSNTGPDDASGVVLTDTLPAGVTIFPSSYGAPTTRVGDVLTYDLGTLAANTTVQVGFLFSAAQPGTITNNASVLGADGDPDMSNKRRRAAEHQTSRPVTALGRPRRVAVGLAPGRDGRAGFDLHRLGREPEPEPRDAGDHLHDARRRGFSSPRPTRSKASRSTAC